MRVTYFGQACTLIEVEGQKILADPWLTEGAYLGTWYHTHVLRDAGVTPESFPNDIDYLFLSHEHQDHFDPYTLRFFSPDTPVFICKFPSQRFRRQVELLGFHDIREVSPGEPQRLDGGAEITIFSTAEYTNDSALLVEGDGCRLLNETDCKLNYRDLEEIGKRGVDIGFYMFSGANWYPMLYDYPPEVRLELTRRRRQSLLRSLAQRVKLTRPKFAVPAAGPCTVLDPELFWLNSEEQGIFIDPVIAIESLRSVSHLTQPLLMAATDVWDSHKGLECNSPDEFRSPRSEYLLAASERVLPEIQKRKVAELPASSDLPDLLTDYFNTRVAVQTDAVRRRINAKLALVIMGNHGGAWTVDFSSDGRDYIREGIASDWTYMIEVDDSLIYPFVCGRMEFFEDLLLSLRVRLHRRPDSYNEPLYHFLYDPDPERLHNWYVTH